MQIEEIVNLSKTKALDWDMRDLSVQICENMEKHTLTWHLQLWLYLFEEPFQTLFSVLSLIFPNVSITNQYQSTNQAHCIYFCLKIKCFLSFSFSLSLFLSLVTHLELRKLWSSLFFPYKNERYWKITNDHPRPASIWPAPPTTIHSHARQTKILPPLPTTVYDQPQFHQHHPQPPTISHSSPATTNGFELYWKINSLKAILYGFRCTFFFISNSIFEANVRVA